MDAGKKDDASDRARGDGVVDLRLIEQIVAEDGRSGSSPVVTAARASDEVINECIASVDTWGRCDATQVITAVVCAPFGVLALLFGTCDGRTFHFLPDGALLARFAEESRGIVYAVTSEGYYKIDDVARRVVAFESRRNEERVILVTNRHMYMPRDLVQITGPERDGPEMLIVRPSGSFFPTGNSCESYLHRGWVKQLWYVAFDDRDRLGAVSEAQATAGLTSPAVVTDMQRTSAASSASTSNLALAIAVDEEDTDGVRLVVESDDGAQTKLVTVNVAHFQDCKSTLAVALDIKGEADIFLVVSGKRIKLDASGTAQLRTNDQVVVVAL